MPGWPSSIGFGFQIFGYYPFGYSDWAEEVTWRIVPSFYRDDDVTLALTPEMPLRKWFNAIKPVFQDLKDTWDEFANLWDANKIRIDQLNYLALNFGFIPREGKDERLRRAEVLNAIRFFLQKGLDNGYVIAGAYEGLLVTITPFWEDSLGQLTETGPTEFVATFNDQPADAIPCDAIYDDIYDEWPRPLQILDHYRTAWIDLFFFPPDDVEIEDYVGVTDGVIANVQRVLPIHVRIRNLRFDGPRGVGGGWHVGPVVAENAAVGGGWTVPVVGALRAVGGGWSVPVVAVPTP